MAAGVQKHMQARFAVAHQNHRVFAHLGDEEIARVSHLAFMADIEPGAGKYLFLFFLVNILVYEEFATDLAVAPVHQVAS